MLHFKCMVRSRDILSGVYRHYKGKYYLVLGLAHHSETSEKFVVYVPLYPEVGPRMAVRPLEMFFEDVEVDGVVQPRFKYIGSELSEEDLKS